MDKNVIQIMELKPSYTPPTLEQSYSVGIAPLKDKHKGEICYVVGRGPSLLHLRAHHFGRGPVIVLNEAIKVVQEFGLPQQVYSMQKDGCVTSDPHNIPRPCGSCAPFGWKRDPITDPFPGVAVLFSQHLSSWCLHGRANRYVFTDAELGYAGYPTMMSVFETIPLAQHFGCIHIVMMCFDSLTTDELGTLNNGVVDHTTAPTVEWAKPHVIAALEKMPHSFFVPKAPI